MSNDAKKEWEAYRERELAGLTPILAELGHALDDVQLHTTGERYLLSGKKLVLTGTRLRDNAKVIIKASSHELGAQEIAAEHATRHLLDTLPFAYGTLLSPKELLYTSRGGYTISVTAYLEQSQNFLARPLTEQFTLALRALEAQEGVHATTYGHAKIIQSAFGLWGAQEYMQSFADLEHTIALSDPSNTALQETLTRARTFFEMNRETIEQYCGFLTHTDFVPHNLRVQGGDIYLLDHPSLKFGNKHESWARLTNFMMLYNPMLEQALLQYVQGNRSPEEYLSLQLMRVYKLVFLLAFHTGNLAKTTDDLQRLTKERVAFWTQALKAVLEDKPLDEKIIRNYQHERDTLRSPEEKERQRELH